MVHYWVVLSFYFYFHPYFGEMIQFDSYFSRWVGSTTQLVTGTKKPYGFFSSRDRSLRFFSPLQGFGRWRLECSIFQLEKGRRPCREAEGPIRRPMEEFFRKGECPKRFSFWGGGGWEIFHPRFFRVFPFKENFIASFKHFKHPAVVGYTHPPKS